MHFIVKETFLKTAAIFFVSIFSLSLFFFQKEQYIKCDLLHIVHIQ